jgi:hypothetical protein
MAMNNPVILAIGCAIGSALLALWVVVKKPSLGPDTLRPSFLLCAIAYALLRVTGPLMRLAIDAAGPPAAMLVVVPILAFAFWSAGVLMRAFIARLPHRR